MAIERRRVFFAGHVQGVGFRMTARRLALARPVAGFVRNCDDGRVELLIEGDGATLIDLIGAIQGEFGNSIRETSGSLEPADGPPLTGFSIR